MNILAMSEAAVGLTLFFSIAVVASIVSHALIRRCFEAVLLALLLTNVVFHGIVTWKQGYVDKFIIIAVIFGTLYASPIPLLIGLIFKWCRRAAEERNGA